MSTTTIASGGSLDLTLPLTSGTNIEFVNSPTVSGTLRIEPSAFENLTLTGGSVATYLGGSIENFQSGDTIVIASLATAYAAFDHAPAGVTAAQNLLVANELNHLLTVEQFTGPEIITISATGSVSDNLGLFSELPASISGLIETYVTSIEQALFNGGSLGSIGAPLFIDIGPDAGNSLIADATITTDGTIDAICYLAGTAILTASGEAPVESLQIGDQLPTRFGGMQTIKWIGRQSFGARFASRNRGKIPVRIAAGALGDNLPDRDLLVSPGHSILIDGRLLLAKNLVNGITITQDPPVADIHYYQIDFGSHDCVSAHGVWAESFADGPNLRQEFHNAEDFSARYPFHVTPDELKLCAPRPERGAALDEALRPLVARIAATPGRLRGYIDLIEPDGRIEGWAQDEANPELPVLLEIYLGQTLLGDVLGCDHRADLAAAGIGAGNCMFGFRTHKLSSFQRQNIRVCRAGGGAELVLSDDCRHRIGLPTHPHRRSA